MENKLKELQKKLGIRFKDIDNLRNSLVHRSYLNESKDKDLSSNERLEYLGDAVLELAVSEFLFYNYPQYNEGELTSFRAALVRTESLADEALRLGIGDYIYMSTGEEQTGGRQRPYILANTIEAIIGAIYLDQGYEASKNFINGHIIFKLRNIIENRSDIDAKSKLQEVAQERVKITPVYNLISVNGPDHNKEFTMGVFLDEFKLAEGSGKSKQEAERKAAAKALENWGELEDRFKDKNS